MRITVNGEQRELRDGISVTGLLDELGIKPTRVAVEVNREVIPKARHALTLLRDGDKVEIVTFVGGG